MKNPEAKLRIKADKLLQTYIRIKYKDILCYVCGNRIMVVGHHFVHAGNSNALRYYIPNIIPVCKECHCFLHTQPAIPNAKIVLLMGKEWLDDIEQVKRQGVKVNQEWYKTHIKILKDLCEEENG